MRRKDLIIVVLIAFLTLSSGSVAHFRVKYVYDGDTILTDKGSKVRYLGIDAPEMDHTDETKSEFMAMPSRDMNLRLVGKALVRLEQDQEKQDRHGRMLAYVFLENGEMVNVLLVRKGLATVFVTTPRLRYFSLLLEAQREAMGERIGIWGKDPQQEEKHYVGSRSSYRFHRPGCPYGNRIAPHNLVRFKDPRAAYWEGFSPCSRCTP